MPIWRQSTGELTFFVFSRLSRRNLFAQFFGDKNWMNYIKLQRIAYSVPVRRSAMISSEMVCFMMSIIPRSNTSWAAMWKECIGVMEGVFAPHCIKSYRGNYSNFHRISLCCRRSEQKNTPADCTFCAYFAAQKKKTLIHETDCSWIIASNSFSVCAANIKYNQKSHVPSNMLSLTSKGVKRSIFIQFSSN